MDPCDCPFAAAVREVETLRQETDVIIVDMHAEATSEKNGDGVVVRRACKRGIGHAYAYSDGG